MHIINEVSKEEKNITYAQYRGTIPFTVIKIPTLHYNYNY